MTQQGFVKDNINHFSALYRLVDFLLIQLILFFCIKLHSIGLSDSYIIIGLIASISFFLLAESIQLYRSWRTGFSSRLALYTFFSWGVAVFAVTIYLFFSKTSVDLSRLVIGFWFVLTAFSLVIWRMLFRLYLFKRRRQGLNTRKVAIFGLTNSGVRLANEFVNHPETGFSLDAFYDDREVERLPADYRDSLQGGVNEGVELARSGKFDVVYIALPLAAQKRDLQ
ncbi:MAG: hypothetical protein GY951_18335 [Psychromonas sp.]|nr:hypothetical protein [Psychromonas sp.]